MFSTLCRSVAIVLLSLSLPAALRAQHAGPPNYTVFAGYSWLSNSLNGNAGRYPLNGLDAALSRRVTRRLAVKIEAAGYYGTNLGAPQRPLLFLPGLQLNKKLGRNTLFVDAMAGMGHANPGWSASPGPHSQWCFAPEAAAGLDLQLTRHVGWRAQAGFVHTNFTLQDYLIRKLPNYFARLSTGVVVRF